MDARGPGPALKRQCPRRRRRSSSITPITSSRTATTASLVDPLHRRDKHLGGVPVLNGLNVAIPDETITVVLGPSGTGKSVLIKHLIGLMFPDSGDMIVRGQSVPSLTMPDLLTLRRKVGVLFQDGALFGSMSVYDNVAFPLRQHTDYPRRRSPRSSASACGRRPHRCARRHAPPALRRDAQARRVRPRARDGARHRDLRRA